MQPIWGWMGRDNPFAMEQGYRPAPGIRRVISGTPSVLGMIALQDTLALLDDVGMEAVRAKSIALTEYALDLVRELLVPLGVEIGSPEDSAERGGHVIIDHPRFEAVVERLWTKGVIPPTSGPRRACGSA